MSFGIIPWANANAELRAATLDFCRKELAMSEGQTDWDLEVFAKCWVVVENGEVTGVTAFVWRPDIAIFRGTTNKATTRLNRRLHDYFMDLGLMGAEVFIQFNGGDQSKLCAGWEDAFQDAGVRPANRYLVEVKPL